LRKGQIFSTDMLLSFVIVLACIGLIITIMNMHMDITSSSVKTAKMHQIAMDAASLMYYTQSFSGLNDSASNIGYEIGKGNAPSDRKSCVYSVRGTKEKPIIVYVCDAI